MSSTVSGSTTAAGNVDYYASDLSQSDVVSLGMKEGVPSEKAATDRALEIEVVNPQGADGELANQRIVIAVPESLSGFSDAQLMAAINEGMAGLAETNVLRRLINRDLYFIQADTVADEQLNAAKEERKGAIMALGLAAGGIGATVGMSGGMAGFIRSKSSALKKVHDQKQEQKEIASWLREGGLEPEPIKGPGGERIYNQEQRINTLDNVARANFELDKKGVPLTSRAKEMEKELTEARKAGFTEEQLAEFLDIMDRRPSMFTKNGKDMVGSDFQELLGKAQEPVTKARARDKASDDMQKANKELNEHNMAPEEIRNDKQLTNDKKLAKDKADREYRDKERAFLESKENDLVHLQSGGTTESLGDKLRELGTKDIIGNALVNLASIPGGFLNSLSQSLPTMVHTAHAKELDALATRDSALQNFINDNTGLVSTEIAAFLRTMESIKDLNLSVGGSVAQSIKA